jgi:signal transduction histidine kinase
MMDIKKLSLRKLSLAKLIVLGVLFVLSVWIHDSMADYHYKPEISFWKHMVPTTYYDFQLRLVVIILTAGWIFLLNTMKKNEVANNNRIKKYAEDAIKNEEETKKFAYFIAHDLKSPAIANFGLIKKISDRYGDAMDARGQELCQIIMKSSEEMLGLVELLNAYIKTKENVLNVQLVSLDEIINTIKEQVAPEIVKRGIRLIVPDKDIKLRADPFLLLRAVKNLVINTIKHGGERLSRIIIRCDKSEPGFIISVEDNGRGINVANPELLFDPFERLEESFNVEGIGLGLAIAKETAVKHGGKIWYGPTEGGGVTFYLSISNKL